MKIGALMLLNLGQNGVKTNAALTIQVPYTEVSESMLSIATVVLP